MPDPVAASSRVRLRARRVHRWAISALATLMLGPAVGLVGANPASAANGTLGQPTVVINPGGGALGNGSDGLRFTINSAGAGYDQVNFAGSVQYCCDAGAPQLNIGGELFGQAGAAYAASNWASLQVVSTTGSTTTSGGSAIGSGSATIRYTAVRGGRTYLMDRAVSYTYPNDFVTETYTVTIPAGNTDAVKFYLGGDAAPGGSDIGYGVMVTSPVRSVISLNPVSGIQFGFREVPGGRAFDGAISQDYNIPYSTQQAGGNIGFVANPSLHDAGLAVQWNLGSTPGVQTATLQEFVNFQGVNLTADFAAPSVEAGDSVDLDFNVINTELSSQTGLAFTATLPAGLLVDGGGTVGNSCSGSLTASGSTVTLTGGNVAAASSCLVSVPVVAANAGVYSITAGSITIPGGSPITNGVGTQSLTATVAPVAPTVWTDATLAPIVTGVAYADAVAANGTPTPTYAISAGSLPAGLSLDATTGAIAGTPTGSGSYAFTVQATNGSGSATQSFSGMVSGGADDVDLDLDLQLKTGEAAAGATVRVQGAGLKANSDVVIEMRSTLGTARTDGTGSFDVNVTLPNSIAVGTHHIVAIGTAPDDSTVTRSEQVYIDFSGSFSDPAATYGFVPVDPTAGARHP